MGARLLLPLKQDCRGHYFFIGGDRQVTNGEGLNVLRQENEEVTHGVRLDHLANNSPEWASAFQIDSAGHSVTYLQLEEEVMHRFEQEIRQFWGEYLEMIDSNNPPINVHYDGAALTFGLG